MTDVVHVRVVGSDLASQTATPACLVRAEFIEICDSGLIIVLFGDGHRRSCEVLETFPNGPPLVAGDRLLVVPPVGTEAGVVVGRIGRYREALCDSHVMVEASESLTLKCGAASIDLRADGKVMVRGEDVLLRAKGTQRIRAGTVSIN